MSNFTLACAAAIALAAVTVQPASANSPPSLVVKFQDLDLRSQTDAQILLQRLEDASRQVCKTNGASALESYYVARICRRSTLARSVKSVGAPTLMAAYSSKWGGHEQPRMIARLP